MKNYSRFEKAKSWVRLVAVTLKAGDNSYF